MKKIISIFLVMVLLGTSCVGFAPTAEAATNPWYKISDINSKNGITSRTDYYDIKGNKTIKFCFAYNNSGAKYPALFNSCLSDQINIIKSSVRFDYKIYRNGKLLQSGNDLKYNSTIKIKDNLLKTCRVYITSYFVSNGKTLYNKNGAVYAKGWGVDTVKWCRYYISY